MDDLGNNIRTEWLAETNKRINDKINRCIRGDVIRAISRWDLKRIDAGTKAGTLFPYENVRVDIQRMVNQNGICFANIQIQLNNRRVSGQSTTLAVIQLQAGVNFPIRYIRRSLQLSLERHENIILQRIRLPPTKRQRIRLPPTKRFNPFAGARNNCAHTPWAGIFALVRDVLTSSALITCGSYVREPLEHVPSTCKHRVQQGGRRLKFTLPHRSCVP